MRGDLLNVAEGSRERVEGVDEEEQQGREAPPWLAKRDATVWLRHVLFVPWWVDPLTTRETRNRPLEVLASVVPS